MLVSSGELMGKRHSEFAIGVLVATLLAGGSIAVRGQDFNEARLHSGQGAYREKQYLEAIDQFRIAAFGFLDRPVLLSESLVRLALAQAAADKSADADETLNRFLEVERRFGVYGKANLEPEIRSNFDALLQGRVSQAVLLSIASLARGVDTEEQKIAKLPPAERRKTLEAAAKREPGSARWALALARNASERGDAKDAERWAGKALAIEPSNLEAVALHAHALVAQGQCADALKDLSALPPAAWEKQPDLYADQLVCLVERRDWAAAEQVARLVPPGLAGRRDVARAQQRLSTEQQRRSAQAAGANTASASRPVPADKSATPSGTPSTSSPTASSQKKSADPAPSDVATRSRNVIADSRRLVSGGKAADAVTVLTEALKADPGNRDLRLALLEAACLSRAFEKCAEQVPLVAPFTDAEGPSMFYAAMALYETGHGTEARSYLERALPRVSGPLVDEYAKKIVGRP